MQILFIDESGATLPKNKNEESPFFVLGGVIIPEEFWHKIKADLERVKKKFKIIGEIKWRHFAPHNKELKKHSLYHLTPEEKEVVRSSLFRILRQYKSIKTLCVVTEVNKAYNLEKIKTSNDVYWNSYKQIIERFNYYLQDISQIAGQKINGIVVCDHRSPNDDKRLQELHASLLTNGEEINFSHDSLIEGVFIAPSHLSVGIQFADLVAGAILRFVKSNDDRFFKQFSTTLRTSESGNIEGYGLVRFPKE